MIRPNILEQQKPVGQPVHRPLKLIGYWARLPHWSRGHDLISGNQPPWPDVRRAVQVGWRPAERERLVAYLRSGYRLNGALGYSACRFECRHKFSLLGNGEYTDGEWVWPEGLSHYVYRHGVMLPDEFIATASARHWKVPPVDQVAAAVPAILFYKSARERGRAEKTSRNLVEQTTVHIIDSTFWLSWSEALPSIPVTSSPPDEQVIQRFCLTVQGLDDPDPQIELFEECVWDKICEVHGRSEYGWGCPSHDIEWISVHRRDKVVAEVLDGLRRYGLTDA